MRSKRKDFFPSLALIKIKPRNVIDVIEIEQQILDLLIIY